MKPWAWIVAGVAGTAAAIVGLVTWAADAAVDQAVEQSELFVGPLEGEHKGVEWQLIPASPDVFHVLYRERGAVFWEPVEYYVYSWEAARDEATTAIDAYLDEQE